LARSLQQRFRVGLQRACAIVGQRAPTRRASALARRRQRPRKRLVPCAAALALHGGQHRAPAALPTQPRCRRTARRRARPAARRPAWGRARSFEDGVRLVKLRGESMQAAADARPSAMVSIIGLDAAKARPAAALTTHAPQAPAAGRGAAGAQRGASEAAELGRSGCSRGAPAIHSAPFLVQVWQRRPRIPAPVPVLAPPLP